MNDDDRAKFERGAELLAQMQAGKAFDDYWVPIGEGLLAVRRTVMTALSLKQAKGRYYIDAFSRACASTSYAAMPKVERSNLLYCMEHLPTILEMRADWTATERANINNPTSMAKRLREFINRAPTERPRNASPMALLREKNDQLARANLDLQEQVAALQASDGSLFDLHLDSPENIAKAIVGALQTRRDGKAKAIAQKVLAMLQPTGQAG
jgi:hypothetical protein